MMTEAHHSEEHHGPGVKAYMIVFAALAVFTAISFVVNEFVRHGTFTKTTGLILILGVAVCKAVLVGTYFMHLIVDWKKLYYLIFPAFILGAMMITVLLPDVVLAWPTTGYSPSPPVNNIVQPHMNGTDN
jgi:cytochrome c oxidase subunit 4